MIERESFIREICKRPDDDTVRLVFADWLDEHDESEWATSIREQIATGKIFRALYEDCSSGIVSISRGFISTIDIPCAEFMKHAGELFSRHPITKVSLTDRSPDYYIPDEYDPPGVDETWGSWHRSDPSGSDLGLADSLLPVQLFDLVACDSIRQIDYPEYGIGTVEAVFANRDSATASLSHRSLYFGRNLARLPPLARPVVKA